MYLLLCTQQYSYANTLDRNLEHTFSASVVLTDSDAFTFGISDFNPNNILHIDDGDLGDEESIDLRQKIRVLSIPYSKTWQSVDRDFHSLDVKFSLVHFEQDVDFSSVIPSAKPDKFKESVYGGYLGYRYHEQLTDTWFIKYGVGAHLMYYVNSYDYNKEESLRYSRNLDGVIYNTEAWAALVEPSFKLGYKVNKPWGNWKVSSRVNYLTGRGWGQANNGDAGKPENLRWINQIEIYHDLPEVGGKIQSVFGGLKRVDLNGDSTAPLGTTHYYELLAGWLIEPPFIASMVENIGIGLSLNYGSALKGGSVVLYFNQN